MDGLRKAIAIDFDGCLCEDKWPEIGAPHMDVINAAIREQSSGAALILWTCRTGGLLEAAVDWCRSYGLEFDAVNANLPERTAVYQSDCRKVSADAYWDDKAVPTPAPPAGPLTLEDLREMDGEPVFIKCLFNDDLSSYVVGQNISGIFTRFFYAAFEYYGEEWLAYRRRPEEDGDGT